MSDPPGLPSALGIEAVEWLPEAEGSLTVRVTGRWRRRRPEWRGQAMLVVEAHGARHRFPAMPEPPSLSGTLPGTWRMTFSLPAELASQLSGRAWLQLGAVVVPLPVTASPGQPSEPGEEADQESILEQRPGRVERAAETARIRAEDAEAAAMELAVRVEELERELEEARREPERMAAVLAERERERRAAEQRLHAERALRSEAQQQLTEQAQRRRASEQALEEATALRHRVRELERELHRVRRAADEAAHLAAAAQAARRRAERQSREGAAAESSASAAAQTAERLRLEIALSRRSLDAQAPVPASDDRKRPRSEANVARTMPGLQIEDDMRMRRAAPSRVLLARTPSDTELASTLAQVHEEVQRLREIAERERARRTDVEQHAAALERQLVEQRRRSTQIYETIEEFRLELAQLRSGRIAEIANAQPPEEPVEAQPVQPERLSEALARLRETSPAREEEEPEIGAPQEHEIGAPQAGDAQQGHEPPEGAHEPEPQGPAAAKPWIYPVLRKLAARDPTSAGRLIVDLLPAQRAASPRPVAYDLVLAADACVQVTVGAGTGEVQFGDAPRDRSEVHFQVRGDLASIARLLTAGPVRRRLRRGIAKIKGDRGATEALRLLVRCPLTLRQLRAAGVRLEPMMALSVVSLMVAPASTEAERFTVAHQLPGAPTAGCYLRVRDGEPMWVASMPPAGAADTTVVCAPDDLLPALLGDPAGELFIRGEPRPLSVLRQWIERAQSV